MLRRQFVKSAASGLLLGPALVAACGDDASSPVDSGSGEPDSGNHQHVTDGGEHPTGHDASTRGDGDGGGEQPEDAATGIADAGGDGDDTPVCASGAHDTKVTDQHPPGSEHHLLVPMADVVTAKQKTYSIQGQAKHAHMVTLTVADFAKLANGMSFTVTSTKDMGLTLHDHMVTVACA